MRAFRRITAFTCRYARLSIGWQAHNMARFAE
jgi:hypothetical protein